MSRRRESNDPKTVPLLPAARRILLLLGAILVLRTALLGVPALTDPTESRYATIAMQMADSGDWVTPRMWLRGELVPYWGKPPLHFWLTAASFKVFGISAWTARLPSLLTGLASVALTGWIGSLIWGAAAGATAALVLATSVIFYPYLGGSIVDMTLALTIIGALASFAAAVKLRSRRWGLAVFGFLALGFLTKGPVALVLAGLPVVVWLGVSRRWKDLGRLPWLAGIPLFVVIVAPWFVAAERATPGFLHYFFVNENFMRFVSHDYGDLYGAGHKYPYGTIWPTLFVCFLPWSIVLAAGLWKKGAAVRRDPWLMYALLWGLGPALLFTVGRQWLPAYLLPGLPGLALVTARLASLRPRTLLAWALVVPVVGCGIVLASPVIDDQRSCRTVIAVIADSPAAAGTGIVFRGRVPHSAQFYGRIAGLRVSPVAMDDAALARTAPGRIVVVSDLKQPLTASLRKRLRSAAIAATGRWAACKW